MSIKIVVGVNTLTDISRISYSNHNQMWYRWGKQNPDYKFIFNCPHRMPIDRMRNMTAKIALDQNADYLMFIDDDVIVPIDNFLTKMIEADKDVVAGWTVIRGYPFNNMFFHYVGEDKKDLTFYNDFEDPHGLLEVDAVGFSCVLIKTSLLREVSQPYFVTGPYNTEDVYFCVKAKKERPQTGIYVDTNIVTGHIMDPEVVDKFNKGHLKKYFEECYGAQDKAGEPVSFTIPPETSLSYEDVLKADVFDSGRISQQN